MARIGALEGREPRIVISGNSATPFTLVEALTRALETCRVFQLNAQSTSPITRGSSARRRSSDRACAMTRCSTTSRCASRWCRGSSTPCAGRRRAAPHVTAPRRQGFPGDRGQRAAGRDRTDPGRGGLVLAQMNPRMPYTFGAGEIPVDRSTAVEVDEPLTSPAWQGSEEAATAIGQRIAPFATDGTTLQLGIGLIPTVAAMNMSTAGISASGPRCSATRS